MICLHKIYIPYICNWDDMCISSVTTKTTITSNNRWAKAEEMKMLHNWWATPHIGSMVEQISRTKLVFIINDVVCIASIVMSIEFRVFIIFILLKHKLHPTRVKFEKTITHNCWTLLVGPVSSLWFVRNGMRRTFSIITCSQLWDLVLSHATQSIGQPGGYDFEWTHN